MFNCAKKPAYDKKVKGVHHIAMSECFFVFGRFWQNPQRRIRRCGGWGVVHVRRILQPKDEQWLLSTVNRLHVKFVFLFFTTSSIHSDTRGQQQQGLVGDHSPTNFLEICHSSMQSGHGITSANISGLDAFVFCSTIQCLIVATMFLGRFCLVGSVPTFQQSSFTSDLFRISK